MDTQLSMFVEKDGKWERRFDIFYNTLDLPESELKTRQFKAGTQNAIILQWFRDNPGKFYTPFDIKHNCFMFNTPVTSIRRAMTTLTKLGYLEKTTLKKKGEYVLNNYLWKLKC